MIIDDNVKDRGHRQDIFKPCYKFVGIGTSAISSDYIAVLNYS